MCAAAKGVVHSSADPWRRPTPPLRAVVGLDSIEPRERFCQADDPMRWLLTVGVRGWVLIQPLRAEALRWKAKFLEVLGKAGHEHYRVRWETDRESVFYPSNDSTIQKAEPRNKRKRK